MREGGEAASVGDHPFDLHLASTPLFPIYFYDTNRNRGSGAKCVSDMVDNEGGRDGQGRARRSDGGQEEEGGREDRMCCKGKKQKAVALGFEGRGH